MIKKLIASGILTTMLMGVIGYAATTILEHSDRISRMEEREKSSKEILIEMRKVQTEIRNDIKFILRRTK